MEREHQPGCDQNHEPRQACNQALAQDPTSLPEMPPAVAQSQERGDITTYCVLCGRPNGAAARYCKHCGSPLTLTAARRVSGIAFLLNEARSTTMGDLVAGADRSRMVAHYEDELRALIAPAPKAAPPPPEHVMRMRPVVPAAVPVAPAAVVPAVARPVAPAAPAGPRFRPPAPPPPPRDWSWLAEQQANLFLFAGAFLVVIAAVIYVAYSGEKVGGPLKMSLLVGFTLAFLAAGLVCLRLPRVVAAGHVFFAIGATLVPLGFVAAYTILSDQNLDPNALWLAGSLTSAMLYTAVATLGLGRLYAFASGLALMSAAAAAAAVADLPVEWTPVAFLALALAMSAVALGGPEVMRRQVGRVWTAQAHVVAVSAILAAIIMALIAAPDEANLELASRWFLPVAFAGALAYAGVFAVSTREDAAGAAAVVALSGAFVTVVYALSLPAEQYAIMFAALALLLGVLLPAVETDPVERRLPGAFSQSVHAAAVVATLVAVGVALMFSAASRSEDASRYVVPENHWFAAPAFALLLAFYLLDAFGRRQRIGVTGSALALAGLGASFVYGLDASVEYHALALTGAAIAMVLFLRWILPRLPVRFVHPGTDGDARVLTHMALAGGVAVAVGAAWAASAEGSTYVPQSSWFLFAAFVSTFVAYALYLTLPMPAARWHDALAPYGLALALTGTATSVVYGLDASPEYYAIAFTGSGILLAAALHGGLRTIRNRVLLGYVDPGVGLLAQAALVTGVGVGVSAALSASSADSTYTPQTTWFLFATFGSATAGYALCAMLRGPAVRWYDHLAHLGLGLALVGTYTSVVYGLDVSAEYYSFAFVTGGAALLIGAWTLLPRVQPKATASVVLDDYLVVAHAAAFTAGCIAVGAVFAAEAEGATYQPDSRWFLPVLFAALAGFYGLAVGSRLRPVPGSEPIAPLGFVASVFGVTTGVVYALQASAEYYAFAFLVPAMVLGLVARTGGPRFITRMLPAAWENAAIALGRIATAAGVSVAVIAAIVASSPESTYRPDARVFLPLAFLAASVFLVFDASRRRDWQTSTALLAALGGAGVCTVYALDPGVQYYGVAFACVGIVFGFGGRIWSPRWLDERARDVLAVIAVTTAWLPFENVYAGHDRIAAGVHLAAAVFYALAAVVSRSERTLGELMNLRREVPVRIAVGWLYAAGWVTTVGYILLLRSLPAAEGAGAGSLTIPLLALCLGFLLAGATARFWRREFGVHLYVMALLLSTASLSAAPDAGVLATVLTVLVAAFLAVAVWEDSPLPAVPAAVFVFMAVAAWQQRLDAPQYVIPLAYSTIAAGTYLAGFAMRDAAPRWSDAARACAAAYALVAPAAGFGILGVRTEGGLFQGAPFEESALYQWSTVAVALVGLLATVESSIARRGWVVVLGTAVLTVSLLLEIGHFRPDNVQPYTATIGVYLVLLGLLGLWKFRLMPELEDTAPAVEAIGAVIVMFPSFAQSLTDGWFYQVLVLVEATVFFTLSVALRRRLLLGTSLLALVLIAGRALFDAINALPNWIVILIAGLALLGIGTAILIGRDRWARWEQTILSWWNQTGRPQHAG